MYRPSSRPSLLWGAACLAMLLCSTAASGEESQPGVWPSGWATAVALGGEDELVVATADGLLLREAAVCTTQIADPSQVRELYRHPVSVWAVASTDGLIASTDYRGNLAVMQRESGELTLHEGIFERWTRALAFAPEAKQIVAGNEAGKLFVWSLETNQVTQSHELDAVQIYGLSFSPDGKMLAVNDGAGHVHLLSWPELQPQREIALGDQPIWAAAFAPDGQSIIAGGAQRKLWRVGLQEGAEPEVLAETTDWITGVTVNSESGTVAACTLDGAVLVMNNAAEAAAEKAGQLPSSGWGIAAPASGKIVVATRKHAVATLGRAWTILHAEEPAEAPAEATEEAETDAAESASTEEPEAPKTTEGEPAAASEPAATEAPASEESATEEPATEAPASEEPTTEKAATPAEAADQEQAPAENETATETEPADEGSE